MERIGIFVGVACHKPWKEHTESLSAFLVSCSLKYDIECLQVHGKELVDAQNQIADRFLKTDKRYLLMLEDDNWGFTVEMLDALVDSEFYFTGIKYFSRHYPYVAMPCPFITNKNYKDERYRHFQMNLVGFPEGGFHTCGLCGFGMTLIKREIFEELKTPYFELNAQGEIRKGYATDSNFAMKLRDIGVLPVGCFDYCVSHRGIDDSTVNEMREKADGKNSFLIRYRNCLKNKELHRQGLL
jgi:hypothetical protein